MTPEQVDDLVHIDGDWAEIYLVPIWLPVAAVIALQPSRATPAFDHIKCKKAPVRARTVHVGKISRLTACTFTCNTCLWKIHITPH